MRKLVFSFLVVFSSIVYGQSGFNPPKTKINEPLMVENLGIDSVRVWNGTAGITGSYIGTKSNNPLALSGTYGDSAEFMRHPTTTTQMNRK